MFSYRGWWYDQRFDGTWEASRGGGYGTFKLYADTLTMLKVKIDARMGPGLEGYA